MFFCPKSYNNLAENHEINRENFKNLKRDKELSMPSLELINISKFYTKKREKLEVKTLILSHFKPYPPNHGAARRIWNMALEKSKNGEKVIIVHNALNGPNKRIKECIEGITVIQVPLVLKVMRKRHFFFQNNPYMLAELIKNRDTDKVQFEFPYLLFIAMFAKLFKKKLIYSAHGIEYEWQKDIYNRNKFWLWVTRLIEKTALKLSDETICLSDRDKQKLQEMYKINPKKIKVVEHKVDLKDVRKAKPYNFKKKTVLFIGSQLHPANKEAIEKIYYKIMPKILEKRKGIQFCFIGKNPPEWLKGPNILVIPEVYDGNVFPYIKGADICIAPVYKGSGTRIKMLEYLACNKPVITTKKGIEGIKTKKNVIIKGSVEEFFQKICELI